MNVRPILIAAAGSGGHVIPAQAVGRELVEAGYAVTFAGFGLSQNPYFDTASFPFFDLPAAPPSCSPRKALSFLVRSTQGFCTSWSHLKECCAVIGFGSYHTFPLLAACVIRRKPFILYEANAIPGAIIRLFSPFALWTGCFFDEASTHCRGLTTSVAHPLRRELSSLPPQEVGKAFFHVEGNRPTLLVVGGSQGATFLNKKIPSACLSLPLKPTVIHLAGHNADRGAIEMAYASASIPAVVKAYEPRMDMALAAADYVISRSGASAICEIEASGRPALYIPFAKAKDDHQLVNAKAAVSRGNALLIEERDERLLPSSIEQLFSRKIECSNSLSNPKPSFSSMIQETLHEET